MSEGGVFRTPAEQLEDFQKEIGEMRTLLRTIADRLTQIERHAKRAFAPAQEARKQVSPRGAGEPRESPPTISPEEALTLFERLTALWKDEGRPSVERRLAEIQVPDLKLIAHQLGVSFSSKPSRRALHGGIIGRRA